MVLACCVRLPLSASHLSQRIIVLFGKHDDLQVSHSIFLSDLVISRVFATGSAVENADQAGRSTVLRC